jgi:hypothetical protein
MVSSVQQQLVRQQVWPHWWGLHFVPERLVFEALHRAW